MELLCIVFSVHVHGFSGDSCVHTWVSLKEIHVHLKKHAVVGRTIKQTFLGFFAVVFLSVGHYPYYRSLDFSIIKSFSALGFPSGFFQGYLPKNIGVYVCMI
jgi:hypothetical protein